MPVQQMVELNRPLTAKAEVITKKPSIGWVIAGGESGASARPMQEDWARQLRDQSRSNDVAFFMKQMGGHPDKRGELASMPDDLQIREFPISLARA